MKVREVIRHRGRWMATRPDPRQPTGNTIMIGLEMKYLDVIEPTSKGFSAYSPDLPGCAPTGATREDCGKNMHEAIEFHLDGLRKEGYAIPTPVTSAAFVEVV
jgi:predicted RNase H-like HicB family nuclease